jgi:hypothetical protein
MKEETQTNTPFVGYSRSFSRKIRSFTERVMTTELIQMVKKYKNKDGRYGNLIKIIGSPSTITLAYLTIKSNKGISAKGINSETLDGISLKSIQEISKTVLSGAFKALPVRRVYISKANKPKLRPLGVSSPRQKIVQKAIELVLTTVFEEIFLDCSHGSRPGRSCHTALKHLQIKGGSSGVYS